MNQDQSLLSSGITESVTLTLGQGALILITSLVFGYLIRRVYLSYSLTYSSPKSFGNTLLFVVVSVSALIAVVKSSLALSLGLVGALSVVRFRTAVKEPFTLSFILWSVCIGIAIGAEQFMFAALVLLAGVSCVFTIFNRSKLKSRNVANSSETLLISASSDNSLFSALEKLKPLTSSYNIKNLNSTQDEANAVVSFSVDNPEDLRKIVDSLKGDAEVHSLTFYNSISE